ncbi:MAG: hypothetical protein KatS3mg097_120 [Candidatus Parcubacteria bacterium]|nr:MAG: hypothetical protein KatS3mg097_120 [Candidatus Parcubacteria bacterium]
MEMLRNIKEHLRKFNLDQSLKLLERQVLQDERIEGLDFKEFMRELINQTGEYFNEETFIQQLEEKINDLEISDEEKQKILERLIRQEGDKKFLNQELQAALIDIFRKHPEKKGVNFRDQINDPQELRGWLYLTTKDERFKEDFERLISQKEKFYFRLWPPYIALGFKKLLPPKPEIRPGFEVGDFFKGVQSYIEDLQKGKDRITLWFEENLLPDELKNSSEEELAKLNIKKYGNIYEFYITPDKLKDIFDIWLGTYTETVKGEAEINNLFKETYDLYNSLLKDAPPDIKNNLRSIGSFLKSLEEVYKEMIETGASKEDLEKIREGLNKCKQFLEELKPDIDEYKKNKDPGIAPKVLRKTKDFLKVSGVAIVTSLGLWGLAIGWFLPLWLIAKMDEAISKYLGFKH